MMKNQQPSGANCFVCGVENRFGLHIRFFDTAPGEVTAEITVPEQYQGYPGIVHGGILATMLDEVASRVYFRGEPPRIVVTAKMNVRYRKPAPVNQPLKLVGRGVEDRGRVCIAAGEIYGPDGSLLVEAELTLTEVPPDFLNKFAPFNVQDWKVYPDEVYDGFSS